MSVVAGDVSSTADDLATITGGAGRLVGRAGPPNTEGRRTTSIFDEGRHVDGLEEWDRAG